MNFQQTEKRFKQLKAQFEDGTLPEDTLNTQLQELMIQDETGSWWMIGYETEQWYRHNGKDWVPANSHSIHVPQAVSVPQWSAVFWITLAWSIGWVIGTAIFKIFLVDVSLLALRGAISGAVGGLITAVIVRNENALSNWQDVIWITLAWVISSAIGWATAMALALGLGGLVLAIVLRNKNRLSDWNAVIVVALAWTVGSAIGASIQLPIAGITGRIINDALGGAIGAAIGGLVTIWQMRKT